jgi:copper chaperone CopZ
MVLDIDGMSCAACVRRVRAALEKVPGAEVDEVDVGRARVSGVEAAAAIAAIEQAGYTAREASA